MKLYVPAILATLLSLIPINAIALSESHLIIVRHGEGECDVEHRYQSDKSTPCDLTEKGRQQIQEVAELLLNHGFDNRNISAVYVSSLSRAKATADRLAEVGLFSKDKIKVDHRLDDIKAGDREGLIQTDQIRETWLVGEHEARAHHGESNEAVRRRILKWFNHITDEAEPEGHIVVITHGIPAMELIEYRTRQHLKLGCGQVFLMPLSTSTA